MDTERNSDQQGQVPTFSTAEALQKIAVEAQEQPRFHETIDGSQIRPTVPEAGGTEIILQRHGKYHQKPGTEGEQIGSLTKEARIAEVERGKTYLHAILSALPEDERDTVDVLIVASDTSYQGGGRRSFETAEAVQEGMTSALTNAGLGSEQILNNIHPVETPEKTMETGGPWAMPTLREPRMFTDRRYGEMLSAWYPADIIKKMIAFEEDTHSKERLAMGGEGPDEIADRTLATVGLLARLAVKYHADNPNRRLIVWADTHYDNISPLVKLKLANGKKADVVPVDYGGGITIDVNPEGHASSTINEETYEVPLR